MKIHYFQHVAFEGPGYLEEWAKKKGHQLTGTRWYDGESPPAVADIDLLVVLGGPMNIYEEESYPWLVEEKLFLKQALAEVSVSIIGICLGAQLTADQLGARIYANTYKEIGWLPIELSGQAKQNPLFEEFPSEPFNVFHWHGDTFDLPAGADRLASSEGCLNQAFAVEERIFGLQFHIESTTGTIEQLLENGADDLKSSGPYVQTAEAIRSSSRFIEANCQYLSSFLDRLEKRHQQPL